jgi:formylglycine-generating enzyme required for sulfatase activity
VKALLLLLLAGPAAALCPVKMLEIEGRFCIDRYEGALVETTGGAHRAWSPYAVPLASATYKAVNGYGRVPQGYISGTMAAQACLNAHKRLCTAEEWVTACRGGKKQDFPYGATYVAGTCNEHSKDPKHKDPMHRLFGANPNYGPKEMNDPRLNQLPDTVAPSGTFTACVSDYGVFDMVGNLHEWVSDIAKNGHGEFHGGYFNEAMINGPGCQYTTTRHGPDHHDYSTGFRCCAERLN